MIKRIIYIGFILTLIGALVYFYIQLNQHSEVKTNTDILEVLPNNAGIIVEISDLQNLTTTKQEVLSKLQGIHPINEYHTTFQEWDSIAKQHIELKDWDKTPALISYHLLGHKINTFCAIRIATKIEEKAWKMILGTSAKLEKNYNNIAIYRTASQDPKYIMVYKNYLSISNNPILLEQSIRHLQNPHEYDSELTALKATKGEACLANIYVNYDKLQSIVETLSHTKSPIAKRLNQLGHWGELDLSVNENQVIMNGFSSFGKDDYWHVFAQQENTKLSILEALPSSAQGFLILSPSDIHQFRSNYETHLKAIGQFEEYNSYWNSLNHRGGGDFKSTLDELTHQEFALAYNTSAKNNVCIIKTHSHSQSKESLNTLLNNYYKHKKTTSAAQKSELKIDNATAFTCFNFPFKDCFKYLYGQAFNTFEANYMVLYEDYIIFSAEKEALKNTLRAFVLKQTYLNDKAFQNIYKSFATKSSVFYYEKMANILPKIEANTSTEFCSDNHITAEQLLHFQAITYQMVNSGKYAYNSILCQYNPELKAKPTTEWSSLLDAAPIGKPTFVVNHYTQENEICIQDALHNLYLISNSGRIIWKKAIGEEIISQIHQIDLYKNGKLQLLFNTRQKLWLLDRDGNFVERYPILLSSPASTGLSLFDYDKNRDYRIFIPSEDRKIRLFNTDGNINKGFSFSGSEELITTPIQHFRVAAKDYLLAKDKNRVYILNRRGQERIKVKDQFSASTQNSFYLGKDENYYFATSNTLGAVKKIYMDGTVKTIDLNEASENHYFAMETIDESQYDNYIIVDQGNIDVYNFRGRSLYSRTIKNSLLTRPYFYHFSKQDLKIGITDRINDTIYLLNGKDGSDYEGFPLVGTTPFSIGFLKASSWRFNLIVGGENKSLYNYKVK